MLGNLSWEHLLVLFVVGLLVLGPERLPSAIRWSVSALRRIRQHIDSTTGDLREQFGPEIAELREPLTELQRLRGMNPRSVLTTYLLDGDEQGDEQIVPGRAGPPKATGDPAAASSPQHRPPLEPSSQPSAARDAHPGAFHLDAT